MLDHFPTMKDFQASQRLRRNLTVGLVIAVVGLIVGTMTALAYFLPQLDPMRILIGTVAILLCMALPVAIWYYPELGLYIVFAGALLFPGTHEVPLATMPTSFVPFWLNLSTIGTFDIGTSALTGLAISPAEIIMVLSFILWFVRAIAMRQLTWRVGAFFWVMAAYITMVAVGFLNGMSHSANMTMALYEVRGQAYLFVLYLMAVNMLKDWRQLHRMLWMIVICNGIQGICGTITYVVQHDKITADGFMAHDESLILNLILFVGLMAGTLGNDRRLKWTALALCPIALTAILGNQRRASFAAFMIAFIPMLPILWVMVKEKRKQIGTLSIVFLLLSMIYFPLAWNSNGAWALPARAIRSQTDPSMRDAASNLYRDSEAYDLLFTRDRSPIIGYGYGRKFEQPAPLPQTNTDFVLFMPHNSILWVWMRIGHIGFFLFWLMIATFLIRGLEMLKKARSPETQLIGMLAILMVLMMLTFGKYDLAFVDLRVLTIVAVLLGALCVLPNLEKVPEPQLEPNESGEVDDIDEDEDLTYGRLANARPVGPMPF